MNLRIHAPVALALLAVAVMILAALCIIIGLLGIAARDRADEERRECIARILDEWNTPEYYVAVDACGR